MQAAPKNITARGLLILAVLAGSLAAYGSGAVGGTYAGATFDNKGLELKIDSKATYNGAPVPSATWSLKHLVPGTDHFFNFSDVKPGDMGCNVISVHTTKSDAWACLDFSHLTSAENGVNEPESAVDPNGTLSGELAAGTQFFGWLDDGDGKYEPPGEKALFGTSTRAATTVLNDKTYVIGDAKHGSACKQDTTRYIGMCWCAGTMSVNPTTGVMACDGSTLGNAAQTDSFSVDVALRAEPAKDKPTFLCDPGSPSSGGHDGGKGAGGGDDKGGKGGKGDTGDNGNGQGGSGSSGGGSEWHIPPPVNLGSLLSLGWIFGH